MSILKSVIILILIAVFVAATVIGVWYCKTKFYIPDKDGMIYYSTDKNNQGDD